MDCSFTVLDGVLGCSVGIVPPCVLDAVLLSLSRRLLTGESPDGPLTEGSIRPSAALPALLSA